MSISRGLLHDRAAEVEVTNDATGAEVKVLLDDLHQLQVSLTRASGGSAVSVHEDGQGVGEADAVGQLHKGTVAQTSGHEGLGDPAASVGSRAVHLGGVLAGESTSTVGSPASVGVDDDLATSEASITVRTTNDESARGVEVVDGLVIEVLGGHDVLNDMLHEVRADLLVRDILGVLSRDHNGVHALGDHAAILILVLAGDLGLAVGAHPGDKASLADLSQASTERGGEVVGQGHESLGLISGITKHNTLITSSNVFQFHVVDRLGDIRRLLLNSHNDIASSVVHSLGNIIVSNIAEGLTDDLLVVNRGRGGNLTEDHDHASFGAGLASNARGRIITDACVKHSIRHLIADLVGVSLIDRFRRKEEVVRHCKVAFPTSQIRMKVAPQAVHVASFSNIEMSGCEKGPALTM